MTDVSRLARERRPEERLHGDVQRHRHHLLGHVADFAVPPRLRVCVRALHHRRAVFRDAAAVERGLRQSPLAAPEITFADQQPLPQEPFRHILRQRALVEFRMLHDRDLLDVRREI